MIKDARYIIKRVIIGVLIVLILSFIRSCEVKAESISDYQIQSYISYSYNNSSYQDITPRYSEYGTLNNGGNLYLQGNVALQKTFINTNQNILTPTLYQRYTLCADKGSFSSGWGQSNTTGVNFINTSIPCKLANAQNYNNAFIVFAKSKLTNTSQSCNVVGSTNQSICTFSNSSHIIGSNALITTSWTLLAHEYSMNDFPTYTENSEQFNQLDNIIAAINTLISNGNGASQITSAINNQTTSITNAQNNTTNAINNTNNTLKDSNVSINSLPSDNLNLGPISALVTLPITALNNIVNAFSGTCTPFNIGSLFGTNLVFPCINIESFIGTFLWNTIDIIITGIYIFGIRQKFVDLFYKLVTLKDIGLKGGF